jgi:hypothetical protein
MRGLRRYGNQDAADALPQIRLYPLDEMSGGVVSGVS